MGGQAHFTAGNREHAEAQFGTVAAFFRPLQARTAIGNSVGAGFYRKAAVFADFVQGTQSVIARGSGVGQCQPGGVPAMPGVAAVPPNGKGDALRGAFAAAGFAVEVQDAAFDIEQLEQRRGKGGTDQQAEATVAREVAANLSPPVVKRAMRGEVVVTRRGLLEEDAGIAAEAFAIGQNVAVAVPACCVGEAPLRADVAGLQVFGKAFLAALVGRHATHITAHDAPAAAFADVFPRQGEVLAVVVEDVMRVAAVVAGNACHSKSIAQALRLAVAVVKPQATIAAVEAVSGIGLWMTHRNLKFISN